MNRDIMDGIIMTISLFISYKNGIGLPILQRYDNFGFTDTFPSEIIQNSAGSS